MHRGNLYLHNLRNPRGVTGTSRYAMQAAITGEYRKVNGILSSAYAEKFYASVSAFTPVTFPTKQGKVTRNKIIVAAPLRIKRATLVTFARREREIPFIPPPFTQTRGLKAVRSRKGSMRMQETFQKFPRRKISNCYE